MTKLVHKRDLEPGSVYFTGGDFRIVLLHGEAIQVGIPEEFILADGLLVDVAHHFAILPDGIPEFFNVDLDLDGRMGKTKELVAGEEQAQALAVHEDLNVIAVGDYQEGHDAVQCLFTPGEGGGRHHNQIVPGIFLRTIDIGGIFGDTEHVKDAMIADLVAGTVVAVGIVVESAPADGAQGVVLQQISAQDPGMTAEIPGTSAGPSEEGNEYPIQFFTDKFLARMVVIVALCWRWTGYNAMYYIAGLQTIPRDIIEAARIDGCNPVQEFFKVVVPQLKQVIVFTSITSTIGTLQLFDEVTTLTEGGPANSTMTVSYYIFKQSFELNNNYGYSAAMSWVIVFIIALLSLIQLRATKKD